MALFSHNPKILIILLPRHYKSSVSLQSFKRLHVLHHPDLGLVMAHKSTLVRAYSSIYAQPPLPLLLWSRGSTSRSREPKGKAAFLSQWEQLWSVNSLWRMKLRLTAWATKTSWRRGDRRWEIPRNRNITTWRSANIKDENAVRSYIRWVTLLSGNSYFLLRGQLEFILNPGKRYRR